jgi:hypothetical protein
VVDDVPARQVAADLGEVPGHAHFG